MSEKEYRSAMTVRSCINERPGKSQMRKMTQRLGSRVGVGRERRSKNCSRMCWRHLHRASARQA